MGIVRNILAVVVGVLVGGAVNMALVVVGPQLVPPPPGADMTTAEGLAAAMPRLGARHFVFPFLAHALGTLSGALAAYLVAASWRLGIAHFVGAFFLAGGIAASFMIPAPAWFIALDLLAAYVPMAWLGTRIGERMRPAATT
ncbi:MAG: hypothetical protein FIB05_13805 [Betaproteobacteria bacterium]|nr:hypothetical protein [Betaproteobacteria bacterium]